MNESLVVRYRSVPEDIFEDLKALEKASLGVTLTHDKKEYLNFTGGPSDILIYIQQHTTELIVGGIMVNAVYDLIKSGISTVWKKSIQYYKNKRTNIQKDKNRIELVFKLGEERSVHFILDGEMDEKLLSRITEQAFDYIKNTTQINKNFFNPDYKEPVALKPTLRIKYNPETSQWEPINYATISEQIKNMRNDIINKING